MSEYEVMCTKYGHPQDPYAMHCQHDDSLLRTSYAAKRFRISALPGIWRFLDWLPVHGILEEANGGPVTYRSQALADELGLESLYISFNGYWPERAGDLLTCSFKELEAMPTMRRLGERGRDEAIVVASAGNTGRAFAYISSLTGRPAIVVVPSSAADRIWIPEGERGPVVLVSVEGDYADAIDLAGKLSGFPGFVPEGGARNVARRDGMGTVMLDAAFVMGELPRHYFQAVGSGTGGISAYEASERLMADGRFGQSLPRLHLAQNVPCAPLLVERDGGSYPPDCPQGMVDEVLFNRRPPYSVRGGVADALEATDGELVGITTAEAVEAKALFEEMEEIDILPAASVAVAALIKALTLEKVEPEETVLLNITGGGLDRLREEHDPNVLDKDLTVRPDVEASDLSARVKEALAARSCNQG
jgi:cysteate synthase